MVNLPYNSPIHSHFLLCIDTVDHSSISPVTSTAAVEMASSIMIDPSSISGDYFCVYKHCVHLVLRCVERKDDINLANPISYSTNFTFRYTSFELFTDIFISVSTNGQHTVDVEHIFDDDQLDSNVISKKQNEDPIDQNFPPGGRFTRHNACSHLFLYLC